VEDGGEEESQFYDAEEYLEEHEGGANDDDDDDDDEALRYAMAVSLAEARAAAGELLARVTACLARIPIRVGMPG
jgi:hypothetical protein